MYIKIRSASFQISNSRVIFVLLDENSYWGQEAQNGVDGAEQMGRCLSFLDSEVTEEEEEKEEEEGEKQEEGEEDEKEEERH